MTDPTSTDPTRPVVRDQTEQFRFELVEGDEVLGFTEYRTLGDDVVEMPHTVIDPAHRGRGLGEVLIGGALDELRRRGVRVRATCPFVSAYLDEHPEAADRA